MMLEEGKVAVATGSLGKGRPVGCELWFHMPMDIYNASWNQKMINILPQMTLEEGKGGLTIESLNNREPCGQGTCVSTLQYMKMTWRCYNIASQEAKRC